jgi:hypothetical protein
MASREGPHPFMTTLAQSVTIPINVGPLNGVGSFCFHTGESLKRFSDLYREGQHPQVEWDLRNVQYRHMSMAGLTAFLATAHRLRQFTLGPPFVRMKWNPQVFSFLENISLFRLASEHDIFKWPDAVNDGAWYSDTNPSTELLMFEYDEPIPDRFTDIQEWKDWKDSVRQRFKDILLLRCGRLFQATAKLLDFPEKLKDQVAIASAELVVNSILWGKTTAFVGLQRTRHGITVAVCDSGSGFLASLYGQQTTKQVVKPTSNLDALIVGSLINAREYGLRRVISTVMKSGGSVLMSSFDAELHWRQPLWDLAQRLTLRTGEEPIDVELLLSSVGRPVIGSPTLEDRESGFCRVWQQGLRGARIAFEIPLRRDKYR